MKLSQHAFSAIFLSVLLPLGLQAQQLIPQPVRMEKISAAKTVVHTVDAKVKAGLRLPDEGYTLRVRGGKAVLRARTPRGLVWARQTLRQLTDEGGQTFQVSITDYPAFAIRGFMHDVGRNFRTIAQLKKDIDLFSFYKLNTFHWHLTDHPAWRIESKAYPQLNDARFQRKGRGEGKFYTYDEIRDLIRYAAERGITVIPEIDMPGHSEYFTRTFGFSMDSPQGMEVLRTCLEEFFREIPRSMCPYIHIGSDEVRVKKPEEFMRFTEKIVTDAGRRPICWDPGLPPAATTICQVWSERLGKDIATTAFDHPWLDSYMGYLNHGDPMLNVVRNFLHTPCSVGKGSDKALGGILCLWNDVRVDDEKLTFPHNGMPETLLPFAERFWCGGSPAPAGSEPLLPEPGSALGQRLAEFEGRMSYHRDHFLTQWNVRWVANAGEPWRVTLPEPAGADMSGARWVSAWGGTVDMLALCRVHGVKVRPAMSAWAETEIYSEADTVMTAMVGFDVPSRSNRMSDGMGYNGYWECQGRLLVNGTEIFPPKAWNRPGAYSYHYPTWFRPENEIPYTDEQLFWMREPARFRVHRGWNKVQLYCPQVFPNNYWYFSFVPVSVNAEGRLTEVPALKWRMPADH
jgi:hexosaminidase